MADWKDPDVDNADGAGFVKMEDLLERHVIIVPKSLHREPGKFEDEKTGQIRDYEYVLSDLVVLDGRETQKMAALPHVELDFRVTGFNVVNELRAYVGQGQPVLSVVTLNGKAYRLEKASARIKAAASTDAAYQAYLKEVGTGSGPGPQDDEPPF